MLRRSREAAERARRAETGISGKTWGLVLGILRLRRQLGAPLRHPAHRQAGRVGGMPDRNADATHQSTTGRGCADASYLTDPT